jgi:dihydrofolate reductase
MKKLKLQVQISVDGFIAGPNSEMDWLTWNMDDELKAYITELTGTVDTMLLGRKLAEGFIPYWSSVAANTEDPQYDFGKMMTDTPKHVFSKTITESIWDNTSLVKDNLAEAVNKIKAGEGKDIIAYGGATFVADLVKHNLIDEYHLFVNPAIIGEGLSIYKTIEQRLKLKLVKAIPFSCGIAVLVYEPAEG